LAGQLALNGKRVLMIDGDAQMNLSTHFLELPTEEASDLDEPIVGLPQKTPKTYKHTNKRCRTTPEPQGSPPDEETKASEQIDKFGGVLIYGPEAVEPEELPIPHSTFDFKAFPVGLEDNIRVSYFMFNNH
jgi:hypothetical protein